MKQEGAVRIRRAAVADAPRRRRGVGRLLVSEVEGWAEAQGLAVVSVRSNVVRVESHPFYLSLGYARGKTQHVCAKRLLSD